ncbi:MAG: hypothetical protein WD716_00215 [Fimbriimonadaceae bacterium]
MVSKNDYPVWVPVAMFGAFIVLFFSAPAVLDDSKQVVVLSEIPYAWLIVPAIVHLFLCSLGLRVYEWPDFDDDERRLFFRRLCLLAVVEVCSWYGGMVVAALLGWSYDGGILLAMVAPTLVVLYWFFQRRPKQVWD